ncbi:hypothetical protein LKO27_03375 [Tessaracoccus sp. OS52]|uniref:hypothetical protein n=1 Tax=Tessaracoccus sp. OS52 TaxID=2886691 RepID=UPI001D102B92|nr:hypothetical protein [Tessaracoccus sp. OS52]MCC2592464.1 hypothetical protein [Tessaracoccus sp. OS52]
MSVHLQETPTGFGVSLGSSPLTALQFVVPQGWSRVEEPDADVIAYAFGALLMRVRVRVSPRFGLDVEIDNTGASDVLVDDSPLFVLESDGPQIPWVGGATGRVLLPSRFGTGVFRQWRGYCSAPAGGTAADGVALFGDAAWVRPRQALGAGWRLELGDDLPAEPSWLPERSFVPVGEEINLAAPDAAVSVAGIRATSDGESTTLSGPAGVHEVRLSDARGTTRFNVGWHLGPEEIAAEALGAVRQGDLAAWLHVAASARGIDDPNVLDELDMLLGEAFEEPTMWGVLAGLRAAATTELPVRAEAEAAAGRLLAADPGSELGPILVSQAMTVPVGPDSPSGGPADDWWAVLTRDDEALRRQVLEWVGYGAVSSLPPVHGARGVALASLWLVTRETSEGQLEVARATAETLAHLLALNSVEPDPIEVAWLLLADSWLFEA